MKSVLMTTGLLMMSGTLLGCLATNRSGNKLATITIAALEGEDYDRIKLSVTKPDVEKPVVSQEVPKGPAMIAITLKPDTYVFALAYFKGDRQTLSTSFCSEGDLSNQKQTVKSGVNQLKVLVCTKEGKPIDDASVEITPIKKTSAAAQSPSAAAVTASAPSAERGLSLYKVQCAACHGDAGQGTPSGSALGKTCSSCSSTDAFVKVTVETMPLANPGSCDQKCATDIAAYALTKFR
ncbi:MAG: cytochrome c [Proteobacteria bacterium]|nr:cytochrome c [Pseudomonadota bacterium]